MSAPVSYPGPLTDDRGSTVRLWTKHFYVFVLVLVIELKHDSAGSVASVACFVRH